MPALRVYIPSVAPVLIVGTTGTPGQYSAREPLEPAQQRRRHRRRRACHWRLQNGQLYFAPGQRSQHRFHVGSRQTRQNPAVHHRSRQLWKGVVRVPGVNACRDTRRAKIRVVERRSRKTGGGSQIRGYRGDRAHIDRRLTGLRGRGTLQEHPRLRRDVQRELVLADSRERCRQDVNGIIGAHERAVSTWIGDLELIVGVDLLARLHVEKYRPTSFCHDAAAVGIERQLGIDKRPVLGEQPLNAALRRLLVASQKNDEVPLRLPPFALEPDEICDEHRGAGLVVVRAAAVEPAVALVQGPWIDRPVLAARRHHVDVGHHQHRTRAWILSAQAGDQIRGSRVWSKHPNVFLREPCRNQPVRPSPAPRAPYPRLSVVGISTSSSRISRASARSAGASPVCAKASPCTKRDAMTRSKHRKTMVIASEVAAASQAAALAPWNPC